MILAGNAGAVALHLDYIGSAWFQVLWSEVKSCFWAHCSWVKTHTAQLCFWSLIIHGRLSFHALFPSIPKNWHALILHSHILICEPKRNSTEALWDNFLVKSPLIPHLQCFISFSHTFIQQFQIFKLATCWSQWCFPWTLTIETWFFP